MAKTIQNQAATTLGNITLTNRRFIDNHNHAMSFVAEAALPFGASVALKADGRVGIPDDEAEPVIGVVQVPSNAADERCTVVTQFKAITKAVASGEVTIGDKVFCDGVASGVPTYATVETPATALAGNGVALGSGADTEEIYVGIK